MNQINFDLALRFSVQIDLGQSQQQQQQHQHHDLERGLRESPIIEEEEYCSDDSVDYVINKAHLYPEQITEKEITKIVAPTNKTTASRHKGACVRCGGYNKGAPTGACYRCFGQPCQFCGITSYGPRYGYCAFCKKDTFVGQFAFKKQKKRCCVCGSTNEGAKGLTNSGKKQRELDCYCCCTFPGCKTHSSSQCTIQQGWHTKMCPSL
jgi:hypothetical protein